MFRGHHSHNRYNHKNFVTLCQKKNKYFLQSMNLFFVFSLYNSLSIRVVSSLKSTGQISFLPERKKINHLSLQPLEFHKYHVISPRTSITTEKTKGQLQQTLHNSLFATPFASEIKLLQQKTTNKGKEQLQDVHTVNNLSSSAYHFYLIKCTAILICY